VSAGVQEFRVEINTAHLEVDLGLRWAGILFTFLASGGTFRAIDLLRGTEPLKTTHPPKVLG
jgi:hypothetical protein